MKADVAMPPSSFKVNVSSLRLSLQEVKESEGEEEEFRSPNHTRGYNNFKMAWPQSPNGFNSELPERPRASKVKKRSQSARRPQQNGNSGTRSDSLSSKSSSLPQRPSPPKSAPSLRQIGNGKGRTGKSRERSVAEDSGDIRSNTPSPQRNQATRTETATGRPQGSNRQRRRRLTSRSEELSSSSGDPQSPRLTVSDRLQQSPNGTLSSEGSEDLKQLTIPNSPAGRGGAGTTAKAWDFFEEHVRNIHDSSDMFSRYQGPSFQASSTFQEAMQELYGYPDYSHPPGPTIYNIAARGMMVAGAASRFLRLRKRTTLGSDVACKEHVVDRKTIENAKRGWRVLKQYVQENYTSKRTSQANLSWSMLSQTIKGLSADKEKTRKDLYRRYGITPTRDKDGNLVMVNTMLSERARQAIANGSRHPLLVHHATKNLHHDKNHPHDKSLSLSYDKALSSPSLPAAVASSPPSMLSRRSSGDLGSGAQRRVQSPVVRRARTEVRPHTFTAGTRLGSGSSSGGSGGSVRNGTLWKSTEWTRLQNRSHTP